MNKFRSLILLCVVALLTSCALAPSDHVGGDAPRSGAEDEEKGEGHGGFVHGRKGEDKPSGGG